MVRLQDFETIWGSLALDADTLAQPLDATIVPAPRTQSSLHTSLPRIRLSGGETDEAVELRFSGTLGEGGMGIVRSAVQVPLGRDVAVKTTKQAGVDPRVTRAVLEEAWVTGQLEHPNIVPIYTLGCDAEERPLIVMKRIEGRSWSEELAAGTRPLAWHLDILERVCNAIEFAHSRGILHRDIKPQNVMIGHFGEVYLVDWGIAVSLRDDPLGRLPRAAVANELAGTPCCMAPEMTTGVGAALDERTDVYLLGATLHEVLTGRPRHDGANLFQTMRAAFDSKPVDYGTDVPSVLGEVCNRATAADPEARFQSAIEFREAIKHFRTHESSVALATRGAERLRELERRVAGEASGERPIHSASAQVRFAFEEALELWPENRAAADGLRTLATTMADYDLRTGNVASAAEWIAELAGARPDLAQRLEEARAEEVARAADVEQLRRIEHDTSLEIGASARRNFGFALALVWGVIPLALEAALRAGLPLPSPVASVVASLLIPAFVVACGAAFRGLLANEANRRLYLVLLLVGLFAPLQRLVSVLLGQSVLEVITHEMVVFALGSAVIALLSRYRPLFAVTAILTAGAVLGAAMPGDVLRIASATNVIAGLSVAFLWSKPTQPMRG